MDGSGARDGRALATAVALVGGIAYAAAWLVWRGEGSQPVAASVLWTTVLLGGLPLVGLYALTSAEVPDVGFRRAEPGVAPRYVAGGLVLAAGYAVLVAALPAARAGWPQSMEGGAAGVFGGTLALMWRAAVLEWFFRGFVLFGLIRVVGAGAVLIQMAAFALLYYGRPFEFLAAWPAGFILGLVAWRCRSFLPSAVIHGAGIAILQAATWAAAR